MLGPWYILTDTHQMLALFCWTKDKRSERKEGLPGDCRKEHCPLSDTISQLFPWGILRLLVVLFLKHCCTAYLNDGPAWYFWRAVLFLEHNKASWTKQISLLGVVHWAKETFPIKLICRCWHNMKIRSWQKSADHAGIRLFSHLMHPFIFGILSQPTGKWWPKLFD